MMQKHKNTRTNQQINQIKILLADFKKSRTKCLQLAKQLKVQLKQDTFYPNTERTTMMKCDLLDYKGLVQLKKSLSKGTYFLRKVVVELLDMERQYVYQKQKRQTQERIRIDNKVQKISNDERQDRKKYQEQKEKESMMQSLRSSKASEMRSSRKVQVPFYKIDHENIESVQTKLDRISKYIASLKKSFKGAAETAGCKFKTRQYLLEQEPYTKLKAEVERYQMREQEFQKIIADAMRTEIQTYFSQKAKLSADGQYYLIKIPKVKPFGKKQMNNLQKSSSISPAKPKSVAVSPSVVVPMAHIQAKVEADFQQIKTDIQKTNENFAQLFSQMNKAVEQGSDRLTEIRQKRKQAFQEDDQLWNQL